jgi:hypothetical protein
VFRNAEKLFGIKVRHVPTGRMTPVKWRVGVGRSGECFDCKARVQPKYAMRGTSPRSRSQVRCSAETYALSARSLTGRRHRGSRSAAGADGGCTADQGLQSQAVVGVRTGHRDGRRDALGLGQHMQLAALLAAIGRFGPGSVPPFGPDRGGIDDRRGPVQPAPRTEFVQDGPVEPTPRCPMW